MTNKINICHVNITSIRKHKDELLSRFSHYDIISINESNLENDRPFTNRYFLGTIFSTNY
jgi:hypothetical protein